MLRRSANLGALLSATILCFGDSRQAGILSSSLANEPRQSIDGSEFVPVTRKPARADDESDLILVPFGDSAAIKTYGIRDAADGQTLIARLPVGCRAVGFRLIEVSSVVALKRTNLVNTVRRAGAASYSRFLLTDVLVLSVEQRRDESGRQEFVVYFALTARDCRTLREARDLGQLSVHPLR